MKIFLFILLGTIVSLFTTYVFDSYVLQKPLKIEEQQSLEFSKDKILKDINERFVFFNQNTISWKFDPKQKNTLHVLKIKLTKDTAEITGEISSYSTIKDNNDQDINLNLKGLIKFQYEKIIDEWYLLNIININLKIV